MPRTIGNPWMFAAVGVVAAVMAPVLVGFAPLGGDPELMYQPIKSELVRSLAEGRLPFWSDRFGLGIPLVAESHVAAFYPPNWLLYRALDVGNAYRLALWMNYVAIAAATFAYARTLGIGPSGSSLASIAFSLCGFQAVHAVHEPFYHLMPFLPLCLILADRYAATGRLAWLAGLAIAWGLQVTLGHFQIQMWTAGLVLLAGTWRVLVPSTGPAPKRRWRIVGLMLGLAWGAAIAGVQLRLTWELTRVAGFDRPPQFLVNYSMPPAHWAQLALPSVFLGMPRGVADYWARLGTTAGEACLYVGVVPMILAFVGLTAAPRDRQLAPWRLVAPLSLAMATMLGWWPDAFYFLLRLPGLGMFRAPARYTLLTSLGLVLLAGRGLDLGRTTSPRRFWGGLIVAILFGVAACAWSIRAAQSPEFRASMGEATIAGRFLVAWLAWSLGLLAIVGWRLGWLGAWAPLAVAVVELGILLFNGPVEWDRSVRLPEESPALRRLAEESARRPGLIAGRLMDVPVLAGLPAAFPSLGIVPPPPNYLLESATRPPAENTIADRRIHRRYGLAYGIWGRDDDVFGTEVLAVVPDPALDRVMARVPGLRSRGPWSLVRHTGAFPGAWAAPQVRRAARWGELYTWLTLSDRPDTAWFLDDDGAPDLPGPAATSAVVRDWDGRAAVVEHDGSCVLVLRRTYYPGWTYRIDGGPARPVLKVDGGLQAVPLEGRGTHRVAVAYHPTGLARAATLSIAATAAALLALAASGLGARRARARAASGR